ncbi:MAG: PEP-CTERM sorting domain-containing protein [Gemmatimonadaceae bacterium]
MRYRFAALMAALAAMTSTTSLSAQTVVVTPSSPQGWMSATYGPSAGAFSGITTTFARSGTGSAEIRLSDEGNSEADWLQNFATNRALSDITAFSFDWFVSSSSTTPAFTTPAMALMLSNGNYLVWEGAYNGYSGGAPQNTWVSSDILNGNFWYTGSGAGECGYSTTYQSLALFNSDCLGGTGQVSGVDAFLGFGYVGKSFDGAVDNISYGFAGAKPTTFNFEPDSPTVTPEPATMSLMASGLVGLGGVIGFKRRRKLS